MSGRDQGQSRESNPRSLDLQRHVAARRWTESRANCTTRQRMGQDPSQKPRRKGDEESKTTSRGDLMGSGLSAH